MNVSKVARKPSLLVEKRHKRGNNQTRGGGLAGLRQKAAYFACTLWHSTKVLSCF